MSGDLSEISIDCPECGHGDRLTADAVSSHVEVACRSCGKSLGSWGEIVSRYVADNERQVEQT